MWPKGGLSKVAMHGWFGLFYYRWVDWQETPSSVSLGWHLDIENGCLLTALGVSCSVLENSPLCSNGISFLWESCIFEDWVAFSSWWWSSLIFKRNESALQSFISVWDASSCLFLEMEILVSRRETNELSRWSQTCRPMRRERLEQLSSRVSTATWPTIIAKLSRYLQVLGKKQVQNTKICLSVKKKDVEEILDQATPPDSMAIDFTEDMKSDDEANKAKARHKNHHRSNFQARSVIGVEPEQVAPAAATAEPVRTITSIQRM